MLSSVVIHHAILGVQCSIRTAIEQRLHNNNNDNGITHLCSAERYLVTTLSHLKTLHSVQEINNTNVR